MPTIGILGLALLLSGSAPDEPTAAASAPADTLDQEVALEDGSEADFFEEEEEVVFADDGAAELARSDQPAFGAAFPEHDPKRWLLLLPLALLALFTLNVRWRAPSK